jgi:hypothetical protein
MPNKLMLAVVATLFMSAPALAAHCPKDAAAIDAYLAKMSVSDDLKAEVTALKDKGMELHNAGNHRESEAALAEAMRMLLNGQ